MTDDVVEGARAMLAKPTTPITDLRNGLRDLANECERLRMWRERDRQIAVPGYVFAEHDGAYPERCAFCGVVYEDTETEEVEAVHSDDCPQAAETSHDSVRRLIDMYTGCKRTNEELRAENARLREAMPTEEVEKDIDYLLSCIDGHPNVADEYERVSEWLARLDAAKGVR